MCRAPPFLFPAPVVLALQAKGFLRKPGVLIGAGMQSRSLKREFGFFESLPDEIGRLVRNMKWIKNRIGMSGDLVYHLTSNARNFHLKIKPVKKEAVTETLKRESEVLNWLKGQLPAPEAVCYQKDARRNIC